MKKKSILFIGLIFLLIILPSVYSFRDTIINFEGERGLEVVANFNDFYKINEPAELHIYVFNKSGGNLVNSSIAQCDAELTDYNGTVLFEGTASAHGNHFLMQRPASIISKPGVYAVTLVCNTTNLGGYSTAFFEATKTGTGLNIQESLIYFILAFGVFILFLISFYFMIKIPYKNSVDNKGYIIKVTKLKYVKLGLILFSWVLFTWFLNILIGLSDNFVSLTMYYGFFEFVFNVMNNLSLPLGIFIFVLSIFEIIRDSNIQKEIKKFGNSIK